jgi:hypothetical protein
MSRVEYLGAVTLVAVLAAVFVILARSAAFQERRLRAEHRAQLRLAKATAEADLDRFGEELDQLEFNVGEGPGHDDYAHAVEIHQEAAAALAEVTEAEQVCRVTALLEDGRFAILTAFARLTGEPLPQRRPPCFFNPAHGPSSDNVMWNGRNVPACAADADRVAHGADPNIRTVQHGDHRVPYWEGGPAYSGWAAGYYSSWRGNALITDVVGGKV